MVNGIAHGEDVVVAYADGGSRGVGGIHGKDQAVGEDEVGGWAGGGEGWGVDAENTVDYER